MDNVSISVFIAAENRLLREAIIRLLENEQDFKIIDHAGRCSEATKQISRVHPEVFLLNPASPVFTDLDGLQEIHHKLPQLKIVLIGMEEDEKLFFEALRQGAVGYILKDASPADVIATVRAVTRGEAVCPPRLCLSLFSYLKKRMFTPAPVLRMHVRLGLTRRERELVPMIAEGLTNKEIAALLKVSEQTVKNHVHRMIQKAGASTRLEIVDRYRLAELAI